MEGVPRSDPFSKSHLWVWFFSSLPPSAWRLQPDRPDVNIQGHRIKTQKLVYPPQLPVSGHIPPGLPPANQRLGSPAEQKAQGLLMQTALDPFKP